jgi:CheY-like chemotaxis protein
MSDTIRASLGMDTPQTKNRLLLVDGDPKSLRVLDVSLKKAGFEVTTATSGREALASLDSALPDLIISDTDLDEMDGFELCNRIKAKPEWAKIPFLFVSGRKSIEDKIRGLELGVDDYLTKPIYIKEIGIRVRTALQRAERERMESRREGRTRFAGHLSDVGVVDLVQTIELNRKSGIIHIVNRDEHRGSIFFRDGKVIDAEVGRLSGAHALYRLFSWSDGQFAVEFKHIRRHDVIDTSMAALLMEGMRRLDEGTRLLDHLPPPSSVLEVDCRVLAEELAELPDEMNSVLRLCDGARTLQEVIEDSDLPDLETLGVINKLFADQIIFARQSPERGSEAEPGVRLANWLSEGGAEKSAASGELRAAAGIALPTNLAGADSILPAPSEASAPPAGAVLSAEETLGAALPSRIDVTLAGAADLANSAETLKGVPVENLFAEPADRPEGEAQAGAPAAEGEQSGDGGESARSTQPMGLAERLLSADSVLHAAAMHEAIAEGDGTVKEPQAADRHTQPYGGPAAEAAAALVQEVVSATHGSRSQAAPPAEPERPKKEVDWGAWPAVAADEPRATEKPSPAAPVAERVVAPAPATSKTSGAELDTSDLEEVEPADVEAEPAQAPAPPVTSAPAESDVADGATRLEPEDVMPVDAETQAAEAESGPASPTPRGIAGSGEAHSGTVLARDSAEITRLVPRATSVRQLWLIGITAFALGILGAFVLLRRLPQPSEPASVEPPPATRPTSPAVSPPSPQAAAPPAPPTPAAAPSAGPPAPSPPVPPAPAAAAPAPSSPGSGPGSSETPKAKTAGDEPGAAPAPPTAEELRQKCLDVDDDGKGKARAVLAACRPALAADPKDAEVMVILARASMDRGRLGEARSLARKALVADPRRADAYVFLGTAEQQAGKVEEARAAYKKYLELAPDGRFAREIRAILNNL